jgi:ABC-type dipeptide/oligopeptide/nickel transport system ATPase component
VAVTTSRRRVDAPLLRSVSVQIKQGALVAVVGAVGSGKSCLLAACLGEMLLVEGGGGDGGGGSVTVNGTVAYTAQESWVKNATLRENIVFGSAFEEERYRRVLYQVGSITAINPSLALVFATKHSLFLLSFLSLPVSTCAVPGWFNRFYLLCHASQRRPAQIDQSLLALVFATKTKHSLCLSFLRSLSHFNRRVSRTTVPCSRTATRLRLASAVST